MIFVFYMNKKSLIFWIFLFILIFATTIRVYHIGDFGIFGDEKQSIMLAVGKTNLGGMVDIMNPDSVFTPKQFWHPRGLSAWLKADAAGDVSGNSLIHDFFLASAAFLFGKSDATLRMVSVLFNILTLITIFYWTRKIHKNYLLVFATLFIASIEPFGVIYSQQARNYTTSMFFTTLCNFYFYLILFDNGKNKNKNYLFWAFSALGALFSTYLTGLILIGQFIFLIYKRVELGIWKKFFLFSFVFLLPFGLWMTMGPGQYFLIYQADAAEQYRTYLQVNGPIAGWIEPSSPSILFKKVVSILSDQFVLTNDLYQKFGFKLGSIALVLFFILLFKWLKTLEKTKKDFYVWGLLQICIPILFLLFAAIKAGTSTGFFLRYASFGIPFGIIISTSFASYLWKQMIWVRIISVFWFILQITTIFSLFLPIYKDEPQKYTFSQGRNKNPYPMIAKQIKDIYQLGDTVFIPSKYNNLLNSKEIAKLNADVTDAQLINLYLDKNDSIIEKINLNYKDSVLLKKKNGQLVLIFDFKNGKFRY